MFQIAEGLQFDPADFGGEGKRIAVLGKSGSGKSNTLLVWAEEWLRNGWPLVIVDPMGQFRVLAQSLPVLVAGLSKTADVPVTADNAAALATWCFQERVSVVLDTRWHDKPEETATLTAFLQTLWKLLLSQEEDEARPFGLIIDEAQMYVPQKGETPLSPVLVDMGKRGRHMRLTMLLATQRSASIDKNFLTQANLIFCHRIMLGADTAILNEILPLSAKEISSMVKGFVSGQAIIVGDPELLGETEDDYRVERVRLHSGAASQPSVLPLIKSDVKVIDPAMLEKLRETLATGKGGAVLVAPDTAQVEVLQSQISMLQDQLKAKEGEIKRLAAAHENELKTMRQQLEIARKPVPVAPAAMPVQEPLGLQVKASIGRMTYEVTQETETTRTTFRAQYSTRQMALRVNKQTKGFDAFIQSIKALVPRDRAILGMLLDDPARMYTRHDFARGLNLAEDTAARSAARLHSAFQSRKGSLILRSTKYRRSDEYKYSFSAKYLGQEYPDLDAEKLLQQLMEAVLA